MSVLSNTAALESTAVHTCIAERCQVFCFKQWLTMTALEHISSFCQSLYEDIKSTDVEPYILYYYQVGLVIGIILTTTLAWFPGTFGQSCFRSDHLRNSSVMYLNRQTSWYSLR